MTNLAKEYEPFPKSQGPNSKLAQHATLEQMMDRQEARAFRFNGISGPGGDRKPNRVGGQAKRAAYR
jgi:hypothetical protein